MKAWQIFKVSLACQICLSAGTSISRPEWTQDHPESHAIACSLSSCATFAAFDCTHAVMCAFAGDLSRNRTVGIRLGKGENLKDITDSMKAVAEGVLTSQSASQLAK